MEVGQYDEIKLQTVINKSVEKIKGSYFGANAEKFALV